MKFQEPKVTYRLGIYPVTQAEYGDITGENPSRFRGEDRPVEKVSWFDAIKFCNQKSIAEGLEPYYSLESTNVQILGGVGYRLPTRLEWYTCCLAGLTEEEVNRDLEDKAWYRTNSGGETHPIGRKNPNPWGYYDMLGNVWEWCWNVFSDEESFRVIRGGSWANDWQYVRSTSRNLWSPSIRYNDVGFRCAQNLY